ncbi:cell adhesion molecule CEACAM1-like [Pyxicephalus adspersus]|uniref:cell adhesion molecule CEACAM1-like n=1 Tax=Pyxicephalus adspersus TaxID=30357 RepID=UPI003B5BD4FA
MVGIPNITASTSFPIENDTVTLNCTSTNAEMIVWNRVPFGATLSPDNRSVTFSRIHHSDSGDYTCTAINPVSIENSDPITILVAYGPENMKVEVQFLQNCFIALECFADSVPEPSFSWRLNGTVINVKQKSFQIDQRKAKNEGIYTCVANNSVTHLTATKSKYMNVTIAPAVCGPMCPSGNGLGSDEIVVIIIGTVIGIFFLEVIVYSVLKKKEVTSIASVYENGHIPQESKNEMILQGCVVNPTQEPNHKQPTQKDKSYTA